MKVFLAEEAQVSRDRPTEVDFFGRPVILVRNDKEIKAYLNICTHLGGPLAIVDDRIQCQWHGACFDLHSGKAMTSPAPAGSRLIRVPILVEEGSVFYIYGEPLPATVLCCSVCSEGPSAA